MDVNVVNADQILNDLVASRFKHVWCQEFDEKLKSLIDWRQRFRCLCSAIKLNRFFVEYVCLEGRKVYDWLESGDAALADIEKSLVVDVGCLFDVEEE